MYHTYKYHGDESAGWSGVGCQKSVSCLVFNQSASVRESAVFISLYNFNFGGTKETKL